MKFEPGVAVPRDEKLFEIYLDIILVLPTPLSPIKLFYKEVPLFHIALYNQIGFYHLFYYYYLHF